MSYLRRRPLSLPQPLPSSLPSSPLSISFPFLSTPSLFCTGALQPPSPPRPLAPALSGPRHPPTPWTSALSGPPSIGHRSAKQAERTALAKRRAFVRPNKTEQRPFVWRRPSFSLFGRTEGLCSAKQNRTKGLCSVLFGRMVSKGKPMLRKGALG